MSSSIEQAINKLIYGSDQMPRRKLLRYLTLVATKVSGPEGEALNSGLRRLTKIQHYEDTRSQWD